MGVGLLISDNQNSRPKRPWPRQPRKREWMRRRPGSTGRESSCRNRAEGEPVQIHSKGCGSRFRRFCVIIRPCRRKRCLSICAGNIRGGSRKVSCEPCSGGSSSGGFDPDRNAKSCFLRSMNRPGFWCPTIGGGAQNRLQLSNSGDVAIGWYDTVCRPSRHAAVSA